MISAVVGLSVHMLCLSLSSQLPLTVPTPQLFDLLDDGSPYYGKPLVTVGAIPFGVTTQAVLTQFQVSIGSWLRSTAQLVVHLYDVVGGMGPLAGELVSSLQREFGDGRVGVRGVIVKKRKIETLPEAFEMIERNTRTVFAGWFSNDMILGTDWMEYVYACQRYFGGYKNYSMHFVRRDLFVYCRKDVSIYDVVRAQWPDFFDAFKKRCNSRLHTLGYDCYLWNHLGINMTAAGVAPFYIGRPDFDGEIIAKQMSQGWFVSTYKATETYHLEHPDRLQYTKRKSHPDSLYNKNLLLSINGTWFRNEDLNLRISRTEIAERRADVWWVWSLNRPPGAFPLGYPPGRIVKEFQEV
jgi:hypothetical protein